MLSIGAGIGSTVLGVERQRRYLAWQSTSSLQPPYSGNALLAAGTTTLGAGIIMLTISASKWLLTAETPTSVFVGFGVAAEGIVLGSALLVIGTEVLSSALSP